MESLKGQKLQTVSSDVIDNRGGFTHMAAEGHGIDVRNGETVVINTEGKFNDAGGVDWKITHMAVVDEKDAPPGCSIGESYTPFCHAPGERCTDMSECYSSKACQYEPIDEGTCFASMDNPTAPPKQDCKADVHFGPVTVSGASLCCSNCGTHWGMAYENPGPK